ncbi:histidine kinase [Beggiatoa alba]|nr:histidine kinase [Beggiatoa alba]
MFKFTQRLKRHNNEAIFLPDLCTIKMVFGVVLIAQLFAFILVINPNRNLSINWLQLSLVSLFVQWCALTSCALLCVLRTILGRLSDAFAGFASYMIILFVIYIMSELTYLALAIPAWEYINQSRITFLSHNLLIGALISGPVLRYFYIQHQWKLKLTAESKARFAALQARIRPHFLFNSLNTIASLTRTSPEQAETAVENLSDLFRISLSDNEKPHTLKQECYLCRRYIEIESLRLGDRMSVAWEMDDIPDDALLPPLTLQPLLENAIYHGIEPLEKGGTISIKASLINNKLLAKQISFCISNPIPTNYQFKQGNQMALDNIRQRLQSFFSNNAQIEISHNTNFTVSLTFPYIRHYEDPDCR